MKTIFEWLFVFTGVSAVLGAGAYAFLRVKDPVAKREEPKRTVIIKNKKKLQKKERE